LRRPFFPEGDIIKVEMMLPPWNIFFNIFSVLSWLDLAMMKDD
jgi:hypothetical protein